MQAQQAIPLRGQSRSTLVAVVATVVAAALALALVVDVERPTAATTPAAVTSHGIGGEQIAHDRSEGGMAR